MVQVRHLVIRHRVHMGLHLGHHIVACKKGHDIL